MSKKKVRTTIGVSHLARFTADEEGFEVFILGKPNAQALKKGNDFHDKGVYRVVRNRLIALALIGGAGVVLFTLFNSNIL